MEINSDPLTVGWPLVDNFSSPLLVSVTYLMFTIWGPTVMKNRKPFHLQSFIGIHSAFMTLLNAYLSSEAIISSLNLNYSVLCQPVERLGRPDELRLAKAVWLFYISKIMDFVDSVIIVLRKKERQLSFLHVYHHTSMVLLSWIGVKSYAGGNMYFIIAVNSFVHVVMYSYYSLSSLGPFMKKYLWWKKYVTMLQLGQFTVFVSLGMYNIKIGCPYPFWLMIFLLCYVFTIMFLFGRFYINSYLKKNADEGNSNAQKANGIKLNNETKKAH